MSMGNLRWFFPSWNGDHRLIPDPKNPEHTILTVIAPTADEARRLDKLGAAMVENEWVKEWKLIVKKRPRFTKDVNITIAAPLEKVGPLFVWAFKPGPAVLTAVRYEDGHVVTCSKGPAALMALSEKIAEETKAAEAAPAGDPKKEEPKPTAAATVKRPTPCCPDCIPGSVAPASEVLLSFLSAEEHETWAKERAIYVEGGLTGALYRIAHRHSRHAQEQSRICMDLDAGCIVHFHDTTVPPEEEVLAAKLILEHREPWLRNEATMLGYSGFNTKYRHQNSGPIFKNPFGDGMDGVPDAHLTMQIGRVFSGGLLR
jgi:hypothetical protein